MFQTVKTALKLAQEVAKYSKQVAKPLPIKKAKAAGDAIQNFIDSRQVRAVGGKGGNGCISFLQLWCNERAGPDGADGGHGGHVIFKATSDVRDLRQVPTLAQALDGENGSNKDCHGKNASHMIIDVPLGTVIKDNNEKVVGDLTKEGLMFVAARDTEQAPKICEYGALGEDLEYTVEIKSMAHVGLIGFPNAGKSTLLRAISRARPKVAPYPFTTLKPYLGIVEYDDFEQVAVADLPGLIPDSHKNKGLGIQFLRHAERCMALVFVLDASLDEPWNYLEILQHELSQFDERLKQRPHLIVANKIDLLKASDNLEKIRGKTGIKVIGVSGKTGENLGELLREIKIIYDEHRAMEEKESEES